MREKRKICLVSLLIIIFFGVFFNGFFMRIGDYLPKKLSMPDDLPVLFSEDFESGHLKKEWRQSLANRNYSAQIINHRARTGNSSLRVELRENDPNIDESKRAEISLPMEAALEEHWYSFSTFLPLRGDEDYGIDPSSGEIIAQWHDVPDLGEEWLSPSLALMTINGFYQIGRVWDQSPLSTQERIKDERLSEYVTLGEYNADKDRWVDWTFHVKWGWERSHKPQLEIFKDGKRIFARTGVPNTKNDKQGVYMKLGIYKWDWEENPGNSSLDKRVVYYDSIEIR
ncbi:polysaccharide lyase [Dehalobacterium formicoaceticum]|uniref:Polysaccharide lyase n=1 Tax=Dehalobacterium formicoaceticum TaxID=51515 RepID=A0ABT1Y5P9_9FIRM|nr:polysaccharide lyase [Dehalobacterium formicoaceticum]MCR6545244.1 polysaccharide lyase [Dehalobacterium formicoaceticum]